MAIQIKRSYTTSGWANNSLLEGQLGFNYETSELKIGPKGGSME